LKSPLKTQAAATTCSDGPARETHRVAMLMAMPWPLAVPFLYGTIRLGTDVAEDEVPHERRDLGTAELPQLVLLDIVQRDLQGFLALQVRLGAAHGSLLVVRRFRTSGDGGQVPICNF
jgi:hypothetical protein